MLLGLVVPHLVGWCFGSQMAIVIQQQTLSGGLTNSDRPYRNCILLRLSSGPVIVDEICFVLTGTPLTVIIILLIKFYQIHCSIVNISFINLIKKLFSICNLLYIFYNKRILESGSITSASCPCQVGSR